ncbi:MAG: helix-turn-helix domain-containing protein [Clostridia bacterium]|nr:helix-turn-helix domain-containing protein [Clostridia bacterium]
MRVFTHEEALREYSLTAYIHAEDCNCELHRHEFFEIEFILSGTGTYEIDNIPYTIEPGMFFFTTPTSFHYLNTDKPFKLINVNFNFEVFADLNITKLMEASTPVALKFEGEDRDVMHTLLRELYFAHKKHNEPYKRSLLSCVLHKFAEAAPPYSPTGNAHIRKALIYILGNLGNEITLESVAKHLGISSVYLCTHFKNVMGISFKNYLDNIRFDYAAKLLKGTDMNITQVAHNSGFKDYANFMRRFKAKYGMTPNDYRDKEKELR